MKGKNDPKLLARSVQVTLKGLQEVITNKNGTHTLVLTGRYLTEMEHKILENLFPNLVEKAYRLIDQEILLNALATDAEANAPAKDETPPNPEGDW